MRNYRTNYGYVQPVVYAQGSMTIRTILWVTLIVILLIIGIFVYANIRAKKAIAAQTPDQYADEIYTPNEGTEIRILSSSIYQDLKGLNFGHDFQVYLQWVNSSDRVFVGVANDYKRLSGGKSIRAAIVSDKKSFLFPILNAFDDVNERDLYDRIIKRMNALKVI